MLALASENQENETMPIQSLKTKRLLLKPPQLSDVPSYHKHFVDYQVIRTLSSKVPWPYPDDGIEQYIRNEILPTQGKSNWFWGIFLKNNPGEIIGGISLYQNNPTENRGFWLGRQFWGQGIMSEAVEAVMDHAFDCLGFEEMKLTNAVGNLRSRRVKERTGARFVKTVPGSFVDPDLRQQELWIITKEEWAKWKSRPEKPQD